MRKKTSVCLSVWAYNILIRISYNSKNIDKKLDNINIEVERGEYIILRGQSILVRATQHQLRVQNKVEREDDNAEAGVHQFQGARLRQEQGYEAEQGETDEDGEQDSAPGCKIEGFLEGE